MIKNSKKKYGIVWVGKYVSSKTINYITKYMLKVDEKHKEFQGKVLCSKGIGAGYTKSINARNNKFKGSNTNDIVTGKQIGRAHV